VSHPLSYELVDVGGGGRLERFGDRLVDRPAPGALADRRDPGAWSDADLRFDRDRGWTGPAAASAPWTIDVAAMTMELRPTEAGQVGLFPEHIAMLSWLLAQGGGTVLSLFAYTGLATLALAGAGASVTHVDASRPAVAWARRNAELSGLADRPVRWIVDDARTFVGREARRGRRYDGLILDPPSYGHGPRGHAWSMEDLDPLLRTTKPLLAPGAFVLLTAHTPGFDADRLAERLRATLGQRGGAIDAGALAIETVDGEQLHLGAFARVGRSGEEA
jgi:23S rRNA (cytosine1962-C5)-methyltransferase